MITAKQRTNMTTMSSNSGTFADMSPDNPQYTPVRRGPARTKPQSPKIMLPQCFLDQPTQDRKMSSTIGKVKPPNRVNYVNTGQEDNTRGSSNTPGMPKSYKEESSQNRSANKGPGQISDDSILLKQYLEINRASKD